jgi:EAL domain-containing protein (putative c-di-GMP-specific phosphodiesterase class I)
MAIARAEEALTQARKQPAGDVVIYEPSEQRRSERSGNARHAAEIVRCLKEDRFQIAFQPVVDGMTGEPVFHEALLRMTSDDGRILPAGHLIPIAETLGLVRLIDKAVAEMVVDVLARHPSAVISLNMSGTTATDPRWYPEILSIIARNRELASRMIIEITETVALGDLSHTIRFVEELRFLGCSVAIDDFGAGYTSFRSLRALPVEYLKLDGTFCRDLSENGENQYYVRSLIDLARTFGLKTVAEWVETEEDARLLRQWGVDGASWGRSEAARGGLSTPEKPVAERQITLCQRSPKGKGSRLGKTTGWIHRAALQKRGVSVLCEVSYEKVDDAGLQRLLEAAYSRPSHGHLSSWQSRAANARKERER